MPGFLAFPLAVLAFQAQAAPAQGPVLLTVEGKGFQVYACRASSSAAPAWVLDHPDANLFNNKGKVVGHHEAGPTWRLRDGSSVKGEVVDKTPSPDPKSIPTLTLRATTHSGSGVLSKADTIRRTNTHGGAAPAKGCDRAHVGSTTAVPYAATYTFYGK